MQNKKEEALELASKTITIWKGILGAKGPRGADSMFIVAGMLMEGRKEALGCKLLEEIVDMGMGMVEMRGYQARALWNLGKRDEARGAELKSRAREVRGSV